MARGISIDFISNTRGLLTGTKQAEKGLEDVSDALDDMARDGDRGTAKLERSFAELRREASRTGTEFDQAGDKAREIGKRGVDIDSGIRHGTEGAGEAVREFGDEAKANVAETFSSFRGEAGDFVQIAQDTFGGVISALGPIGMVAGAAGALGIGLIQGKLEESAEKAQALRERIGELTADFIETGGVGESSIDAIVERLKALATETDESADNLAKLRKDAASSSSGFAKIADAYAGQTNELSKLVDKEQDHLDVLRDAAKESGISWRPEDQAKANAKRDAQQRIVDGLSEAESAAKKAESQESAWLASNGPAYAARAQQIDAIQGELDDAVGAWQNYYNEEKKTADPSGYIAAINQKIQATANFSSNVQQLATNTGLSFEEAQAVLDQGVSFAPMLQKIMDGGPQMQQAYASAIQGAVNGGQAIVDGQPVTITAKGDTVKADADLRGVTGAERTATIGAKAQPEAAASQLDKTTNAKREATITAKAKTGDAKTALDALTRGRTANVTARVDTSSAEAALSRWANQYRTTTVYAEVRTKEGKKVS